MSKRYAAVIISGIFLATTAFAGVTDDVKKTVDELFVIATDKNLKNNSQQLHQALKKSIRSIFDYSEMAKRTLGRHWKMRTQTERTQFTDLLASLLDNTYINKFVSYNNEKVVYLKETLDGNYAEVKSKVITAKHDEYSLDYRLHYKNGRWMVYDIVIEGVSLVSNYRTQFNSIINNSGYSELVKRLQTKTSELNAP